MLQQTIFAVVVRLGMISYGSPRERCQSIVDALRESGGKSFQLQACVHFSPLFEEGTLFTCEGP